MAASMGRSRFRVRIRVSPANQGVHLSHNHHAGTGTPRVVSAGKSSDIRPGSGLKAMLFDDLQTIALRFNFLKSGFRMMPEPVSVFLNFRKQLLYFFFQLFYRFLVYFSHDIPSSYMLITIKNG